MEDFRTFLKARLAGQQKEGDAHPEADLLTAFVEARLASVDRKRVLTHLAVCGDCREVVALVAGDGRLEPAPNQVRFRWWNWRWAAPLAAACVVGVVIWHSNSLPPAVLKPMKPAESAETAPKAEIPKTDKPVSMATRSKTKRQLKMQAAVQSPALAKTGPRPFELSAPPAPSTAEIAKAGQDTTRAMEPVEALKAAPRPTVPATAMAFQNSPPTFMKALGRPPRRQSLWSIGVSNGVLERSDDGGKTWTAIPVGGQTNFLAVSVSGPDIWAGNESGALFHSTDDGSDWKEVRIADGSERLRDSITGIETQGSQVKVRTKSGNWVSADGGVTWRKMGE